MLGAYFGLQYVIYANPDSSISRYENTTGIICLNVFPFGGFISSMFSYSNRSMIKIFPQHSYKKYVVFQCCAKFSCLSLTLLVYIFRFKIKS